MIPKIIHYCWFGQGEKNETLLRNIEEWKKKLDGYTIIEWNESNFNVNLNQYSSDAYKLKKMAFVSDVCRLFALSKYGGIYLDTDVEILKPFDPFLINKSFIGEEQNGKLLGTAVIGAEPNTEWVSKFLLLYNELSFVEKNRINNYPNTARITNFFKSYLGEKPTIYPVDFFCAKDYKTHKIQVTSNTVAIHHYAASWVEKSKYEICESKFWNALGLRNLNLLGKIYWKILDPIKKAIGER